MSKLIAVLLASLAFSAAVHAADPAQEKAAFQRRLDSVKTLTAALQRDNDAGTPAVKEALASVNARQKEAEELAGAGEYEVAREILDEGYKKLTGALMKAKTGEGYQAKSEMVGMTGSDGQLLSATKMKSDLTRKSTSADAMLDAAKRTDTTKGGTHGKEIAAMEAQIAKAKSAAASGDLKTADKLIDEVLLKEKQLIASLASGGGYKAVDDTMSGMAGSAAVSPEKLKADYERKLMSASALLDAEKRVDEKGTHRSEIAAHEADIVKAKAAAAKGDFANANQLIDDVLLKEKKLIATTKADSSTAGLKSGSAADASASGRDMSGMTGDEKKAEVAKTLRSATSLRDLISRRSQERGIDSAATLAKIEQLIGEARKLESADPGRAMQVASSAYDAAKAGLAGLPK